MVVSYYSSAFGHLLFPKPFTEMTMLQFMYFACFWKSVGCSCMTYVLCVILVYMSFLISVSCWFDYNSFCIIFFCFILCVCFYKCPCTHGGRRSMFAVLCTMYYAVLWLFCLTLVTEGLSLNLKLVWSWSSLSDPSVSNPGSWVDKGIEPTISATLLLNFPFRCWIEPFTLYYNLLFFLFDYNKFFWNLSSSQDSMNKNRSHWDGSVDRGTCQLSELNLIPVTYMVEARNQLLRVVLTSIYVYAVACALTWTGTHIDNK